VPLSGFRAYYETECWTWELQALTRARFVAGDADLGADICAALSRRLDQVHGRTVVADEVAAMRALMQAELPPRGEWDQKRAEGGLIDIEFIAQSLQLDHADALPWTPGRRTDDVIDALCAAGLLSGRDARFLLSAHRLYAAIQHVQAAVGVEALDGLSGPARQALLRRTAAASLPALKRRVRALRALVRARFEDLIGLVEEPGLVGSAA
jgi:glutamate-ammonia-ligase adenylyltransferase